MLLIPDCDLRFEENVSRRLSQRDFDLQDGVVWLVFVFIIALQEVLALRLPRTRVLCQIQLYKPKLCVYVTT